MRYNTVIISDLHLGSKASRRDDILGFLEKLETDTLILNGDIIDGWALKRGSKWTKKDTKIIRKLLKISETDTEVIWIRGNHDEFLKDFLPFHLGNIKIVEDWIHQSNKTRYYIFHGDVLDIFITKVKWLAYIGSIGYDIALWINRWYNRWRSFKGLPYYSISKDIKNLIVKYYPDMRKMLNVLQMSVKDDAVVLDDTVLTSNTVYTGVGGVPTWTSSVTKRLVRTIQKNNCDAYGIGSFQEVYSPFFTATYTSTISQADADTNANNNATALCNQWLDANGQAAANQSGTCQYGYPQMTLSKTMPGAFNLNQSGEVEIIMRTLGAATSGQIVMFDDLASGFEYVSLITKPDIFDLNIYGRSVTFTTNASLPAGYFASFKFLVRGITVGNYTNFASAYGGSILNNNATSNTVSTYVFSTPIFSFTRVIDNQSYYNGTSINANAAPTDLIYNGTILTINSFPSTNDSKVRIEFELPIPFRVVDDVQVNYNTDYFTFSQGSAFNIAVFTQKDNVTVPVGQYGFYIFFSLPITYYRMSTVSQDEDLRPEDNLVIDALNITVPRKRVTLVKNYVNNTFINSGDITTIWSNNYSFLPIFIEPLGRIPNDVNGLTYTYSVNNQANYSQPQPMGFINQQFFAYSPIYVVNPTRDTSPGVVNVRCIFISIR